MLWDSNIVLFAKPASGSKDGQTRSDEQMPMMKALELLEEQVSLIFLQEKNGVMSESRLVEIIRGIEHLWACCRIMIHSILTQDEVGNSDRNAISWQHKWKFRIS